MAIINFSEAGLVENMNWEPQMHHETAVLHSIEVTKFAREVANGL